MYSDIQGTGGANNSCAWPHSVLVWRRCFNLRPFLKFNFDVTKFSFLIKKYLVSYITTSSEAVFPASDCNFQML